MTLDVTLAASAVDPYPFYADLAAKRPMYRDEKLGMWVAADASSVEAVLLNASLLARPESEPVPVALAGTPVGDIYSKLVRMTDGPSQATAKSALSTALRSIDARTISAVAELCARDLLPAHTEIADTLRAIMYGLPALTVARLLGLVDERARQAADEAGPLSRAITASGIEQNVGVGRAAASRLTAAVKRLIDERHTPETLLSSLLREGRSAGVTDDSIVANVAGFFFQGYEAGAGLIGNTLVALARESRNSSVPRSLLTEEFIDEVARHDSPVQNTRRFASDTVRIGSNTIREGDAVLVVLAAANRDPRVNPNPERFDAARQGRRMYTFGLGAHACPGANLATTIAREGVSALLCAGLDLRTISVTGYMPLPNVRIPIFARSAPA